MIRQTFTVCQGIAFSLAISFALGLSSLAHALPMKAQLYSEFLESKAGNSLSQRNLSQYFVRVRLMEKAPTSPWQPFVGLSMDHYANHDLDSNKRTQSLLNLGSSYQLHESLSALIELRGGNRSFLSQDQQQSPGINFWNASRLGLILYKNWLPAESLLDVEIYGEAFTYPLLNSWFQGSIYLRTQKLFPVLQLETSLFQLGPFAELFSQSAQDSRLSPNDDEVRIGIRGLNRNCIGSQIFCSLHLGYHHNLHSSQLETKNYQRILFVVGGDIL